MNKTLEDRWNELQPLCNSYPKKSFKIKLINFEVAIGSAKVEFTKRNCGRSNDCAIEEAGYRYKMRKDV
jgi:hypothetical protein